MPRFDSAPPTDLGRSGFRLIRTPTAHALTAHVICDNLIGCRTHFVGNRTIPCEAPDCETCNSGIGWRWHGYLAIVIAATQEVAIFECTARSAAAFADYFKRYGTTRGCYFKAQRLNGRSNGRVLIQCKPADLAKINLPEPPEVQKCLCHIWNIPQQQVETTAHATRPPFKSVAIDRNKPETIPIPAQRVKQLMDNEPLPNDNGKRKTPAT